MLEQLIEQNVKSLSRAIAPEPDPVRCLRVQAVAPHSVAAHAGLAEGDLFVRLDDIDATDLQRSNLSVFEAEACRYSFYAPRKKERIELHTTGIPIGVKLTSTVEALRANASAQNVASLVELWERGDWGTLGRLTSREVKLLTPEPSFTDKLLKRPTPLPDSIAVGFLGAAMYETGKEEEGLAHIRHVEGMVDSYTTVVGAIPRYYEAREMLKQGQRAQAAELLWRAHSGNTSSDRLLDLMEKAIGKRPAKHERLWLGRRFPSLYEVPGWYDDAPALSLERTLGQMPEDKLFLVCMLANYRANGPYNEFMSSFINYGHYFADHFHGLHVLSSNPVMSEWAADWSGAEARAFDLELPFEIGLEDGSLTDAVGARVSPYLAVLNKAGIVVHEHELTELDVWRLAASP